MGQVVGENEAELKQTLSELGIFLKPAEYGIDVKPLLKLVMAKFFGDVSGFMEMLVTHVPSPNVAAKTKIPVMYTGPLNSTLARGMLACDPSGPLVIHVVKVLKSSAEATLQASHS